MKKRLFFSVHPISKSNEKHLRKKKNIKKTTSCKPKRHILSGETSNESVAWTSEIRSGHNVIIILMTQVVSWRLFYTCHSVQRTPTIQVHLCSVNQCLCTHTFITWNSTSATVPTLTCVTTGVRLSIGHPHGTSYTHRWRNLNGTCAFTSCIKLGRYTTIVWWHILAMLCY